MSVPTIALQLYSVRDALARDRAGTLARVAALGVSTVETFDFVGDPAGWAAVLDAAGLRTTIGHAPLASDTLPTPGGEVVTVAPSDEVFTAAAQLGLDIVIDPYTDPARWRSADGIADIARRLNDAARAAGEFGLRVGYHNHWQEMSTAVDDRYGIEVLADRLDDGVVLEVDLYWATVGGVTDVPGLVQRLGERVVAVHVKDGTLEPERTATVPPTDQVPAGRGHVDLATALDVATGLEFAVIEFDAVDGDVFDAIAGSYHFLTQRGLG
jgi:sugar phosphate isomerase/epimerase